MSHKHASLIYVSENLVIQKQLAFFTEPYCFNQFFN